jgi:hypothetical protein
MWMSNVRESKWHINLIDLIFIVPFTKKNEEKRENSLKKVHWGVENSSIKYDNISRMKAGTNGERKSLCFLP